MGSKFADRCPLNFFIKKYKLLSLTSQFGGKLLNLENHMLENLEFSENGKKLSYCE